ncbi:hypothetical protein H2198_000440 [Neophaeococcomyces mojaviensis]|uniref:Uncharacterized protein n=1 Tax=Neophaeococcomyces mojaviensis TaxID=3383035 RepID=A0ACC3AK07_9EURO|nr:hypothetical protein H2198_000440 [Knufia sp. JES_112]
MSSSISLPPISAIHTTNGGHAAPHDLIHNVHPPTRTLPPPGALSYYPTQAIPQPPGYVIPGRPVYADVGTHYGMSMHRMPLPSDPPPNILVAVSRHTPKTKEVKRRTKTGCMTCRKRRIKCGEERPECRNCIKSKRQCAGYDPVFQAQSSHSIQPAPTSGSSTSSHAHSHSQPPRPYNADPISPTASSHNASGATSSPRDHTEFPYHHRASDPLLPNINQGYKMENHHSSSHMNPRCKRV